MKVKKIISAISIVLAMLFCFTACNAKGAQGEKGEKGDQGIQGEKGEKGEQGIPGEPGTKVTIGENGNWFLDGVDTGVKASGDCNCGGKDDSNGEVDDDGYTPVVRFAVTSDIHIREEVKDYNSKAQLTKFIHSAYDYSEAQTDYGKLDGMFFVGDQTQNGLQAEQTYFFDYFNFFIFFCLSFSF